MSSVGSGFHGIHMSQDLSKGVGFGSIRYKTPIWKERRKGREGKVPNVHLLFVNTVSCWLVVVRFGPEN